MLSGRDAPLKTHGLITVRTCRNEGVFCGHQNRQRLPLLYRHGRSKELQQCTFGTVVQSKIAYLPEPRRQHMLQEAGDELMGLEAHRARFVGLALAITQRDEVRLVPEDGALGERDAVDVPRQVSQCLLAGSDRLGVDHPLMLPPHRGLDRGEDLRVLVTDRIAEACAKYR